MQSQVKYSVHEDEFIIENYNHAKPFASFFPGVSGIWGKPLWVFYTNRAQAVSCFGTKDKDGAMLEFDAANKAYRKTSLQGFRTFIKHGNEIYEPFKNAPKNKQRGLLQRMHISSSMLKLVEINKKIGLEITVEYFTLPNECFPALARRLYVKNISKDIKNIELIDGLPMIIPYGTNNFLLKNISRLAEGWYNGVFFTKKYKVPVYKLPVEPLDRPEVIPIKSGNFYAGFYNKNNEIQFPEFIIDSDTVFGHAKDFSYPYEFIKKDNFIINPNLTGKNKTPSAMGCIKTEIKQDETLTYNSLFGNSYNAEHIDSLITIVLQKDYFDNKEIENKNLINTICNNAVTKSSSDRFDNYCRQNYLDNLLRGGYPVTLGTKSTQKNYYTYSRIHGDMEREYNNFIIMPEYFSQGSGNYRDINQNRRNDVFFNPNIKDEQIIMFMNLIQTDGFNPLKILGVK
ncbi:hypothetical protein ACFL4O_02685, partial [bacterium]